MEALPDLESVALTLERLGPTDVLQLAALERICFACPWSEAQYAQLLEDSRVRVVGASHGDVLVAYCSFYHAGDEMEILNLATAPDWRRRGLGRRLLAFVLRIGQQMGIEQVVLEVRVTNTAARALYDGMGFVQVGVRKGYYPDTGEDALVLVRALHGADGHSTCNDHRGIHEKADGGKLEDVQNP
ncbi:ribosomal protein S18-alanine N-acetyltransferase [Megalodesulfovibrio gigas]|uniref:ribosomal protein S18-alanine N-acetyltransferase n=1 Tax=Megalodesulfovibrio gigas TaxID=879 RepID=UPI00041F4170|nr:ribosomal protein S18-alanine N-acetyltransferase [Megalodesulfovibrio gigas]